MTAPTIDAPDFTEPTLDELDNFVPAPEPEPEPEQAPYGVTREGKPRGKPGPKPGMRAKTAPPPRKATTRPTRSTSPSSPASSPASASRKAPEPPPLVTGSPKRSDYLDGLLGYAQLPQMALCGAAMLRNSTPLMADAAVIGIISKPVAGLIADLAVQNQGHRAVVVLDRVLIAGPYATVVTAILQGAAQIACNHGRIVEDSLMGRLMGVKSPDALANQMLQDLREAAEQAV